MLLSDGVWLFFNIVMVVESLTVIRELREFPYATPALDWQLSYIYFIFIPHRLYAHVRPHHSSQRDEIRPEKRAHAAPDRIETEETRKAFMDGGKP